MSPVVAVGALRMSRVIAGALLSMTAADAPVQAPLIGRWNRVNRAQEPLARRFRRTSRDNRAQERLACPISAIKPGIQVHLGIPIGSAELAGSDRAGTVATLVDGDRR